TFSLPLVLGAMVGNASEDKFKQLEEFGENLGIVFQIVDDKLGITGDSKITGKPVGNDIVQNKKTVFRKLLFDYADKNQKQILNKIFGNKNVSSTDVEKVIGIANKLDTEIKLNKKIGR